MDETITLSFQITGYCLNSAWNKGFYCFAETALSWRRAVYNRLCSPRRTSVEAAGILEEGFSWWASDSAIDPLLCSKWSIPALTSRCLRYLDKRYPTKYHTLNGKPVNYLFNVVFPFTRHCDLQTCVFQSIAWTQSWQCPISLAYLSYLFCVSSFYQIADVFPKSALIC